MSEKRNKIFLIACALLINLFFFYFHQNRLFFDGLLLPHGEIAYNVCKNNSIKTNPQRIQHCASFHAEQKRLIDYEDVDHSCFGESAEFRSINDTVGYGVALGLLWKLTGSCRYWHMQLLQIILFSLFMWLLYDIAFLLFGNTQIAFFCGIAQLFFFPLIYLNVQALRDIWAYYAIIFLLYAVLAYVKGRASLGVIVVCAVGFALFQGIRPTVLFTLATVSLAVWWWFKNSQAKKMFTVLGIFWAANILFFWAPFIAYNKIAYGQFIVSPAGEDLYEGLGEFPNSKGYVMDDGIFEQKMKKEYGLMLGTVACDEKGKELFWQAVKEDPKFYVQCLVQRLRFLFFFNPLWTSYVDDLFAAAGTLRQKAAVVCSMPGSCVMKVIDYAGAKLLYAEFFLLLGWLGCLLLLFQKNYFPVVMVMAVVLSSVSKFPSHMESRYLVTFYWAFSFFVGYLAWFLYKNFFTNRKTKA